MLERAVRDFVQLLEITSVCLKNETYRLKDVERFIEYISTLDLSDEDDVYDLSWELKCFLFQQPKLPSFQWEKGVIEGDIPLYGVYGKEHDLLSDLISLTVKNAKVSPYFVEFPGYFLASQLQVKEDDDYLKDKEIVISNDYNFASKENDIGIVLLKPSKYDIRSSFSKVLQQELVFDEYYIVHWDIVYRFLGIDTKIYYEQVEKFGKNWLNRHEAIIKSKCSSVKFRRGMWELHEKDRLYKEFNEFLVGRGYKEI